MVETISKAPGVNWDYESHHVPCMAHVLQLIFGSFFKSLGVSKQGDDPIAFDSGYVEKVRKMKAGFSKTVEKVLPTARKIYLMSDHIKCRKMAVALSSSPQRRDHFLEIQRGHVTIPVVLLQDVKTRWNSLLACLQRAKRCKEFTRQWMLKYTDFQPLWLTEDEWKQIDYIINVSDHYMCLTPGSRRINK
jgi:hypothetical protein